MLFTGDKNTLRICSLGCGNGHIEKLVLHEIQMQYPNISIEFVGVEINTKVFQEAQKQLVFSSYRVKVTLYNQDFMLDIPEESFDLVLSVHSLYYIECCLDGIMKLKNLMKETGSFL